MKKEKTALEEFKRIGFWNMRCVKISLENQIAKIIKRREVKGNGKFN